MRTGLFLFVQIGVAGWRVSPPAFGVGLLCRALSGLRRAPLACEITVVAVKRRPDKRSAIRQKCAAQKKTAPLARFSVTDYYF